MLRRLLTRLSFHALRLAAGRGGGCRVEKTAGDDRERRSGRHNTCHKRERQRKHRGGEERKKERQRQINNNYNNNDSKNNKKKQRSYRRWRGGGCLGMGGANGHYGGDEEVCNITEQEEGELKGLQSANQTGVSLVIQGPLVRRSNQLKGPVKPNQSMEQKIAATLISNSIKRNSICT